MSAFDPKQTLTFVTDKAVPTSVSKAEPRGSKCARRRVGLVLSGRARCRTAGPDTPKRADPAVLLSSELSITPRGGSQMNEDTMTMVTEFDLSPPTDEQLRGLASDLNEDERRVLLEHGTEAPFCGLLLDEKRNGVFTCRLCGLPLFKGGAKFESGTGWPSFTSPFAEGHLETIRDTSYGMVRTEIVCARCGGHQGHVFPEGQAWKG